MKTRTGLRRQRSWKLGMCLALVVCVGGSGWVVGGILDELEIDGNILEGPDDLNDCDLAPPADVLAAPDWASIFTTAKGCFDPKNPDAGSLGACTTDADCGAKEECVGFVTGVATLPANGIVAAFVRDDSSAGSLDDCNVFGSSSDKNGDPINTWDFKEGGTPPKTDISNVYAYEAADGDDRFLYLALERPTNNGDAHIDFEINQGEIGFNPPADPGTCPTGMFTGQRCHNDLLIVVDYERGGALGQLRVFRYEGGAGADGIFCNGDDPVPVLNETPLFDSSANPAALVTDAATGRLCFKDVDDLDGDSDMDEIIICGANSGQLDNEIDINAGPWVSVDNHAKTIDCLPANFFTELAVNRTAFGLGGDRCVSSINAKSRSSHSIKSELKDFAFLIFDTCSNISGKKEEVATILAGETADCDTVVGPIESWEIRLFEDANGDGCPGVCGVADYPNEKVTTNGNGDPLTNPVFTGADGVYSFDNLENGKSYIVCEILPPTPLDPFSWDHCLPDSPDAGEEQGAQFCYVPFTLGSDTTGKDFRNFKEKPICDLTAIKFCDSKGDGSNDFLTDSDDVPLAGFCLCVTELSSSTTVCGVTASDGGFTSVGVAGETYRVVEDLTGAACSSDDKSAEWLETTSSPIDVTVPVDAGVCPGPEVGNTSRPTIDCGSANVTLNNAQGLCTARHCFIPTDSNACGGVDTACTAATASGPVVVTEGTGGQWCGDFPAACPETTTVTCVATTDAGQTASCTFDVTVTDNEAPVLSGVPGNATGQCDSDLLAPASVTCADNCDGDITPVFSETDNGTCPRTIVRTWTCTDSCGNEVSDSQTITINDTTDPVLSGVPDDVTGQCDSEVLAPATVTCSDNCDGDITPVFSETDTGTCPRTIVRTWTCTDTCGNEVSDSQTITINDTTDPVLSGVPDDVTEQCDADVPAVATVTCSDNCDGDITPVFSETDNGTCPRTIVRTWTCTDSCGNEVSDSQTITIDDTTDPVLSGVPDDATGQCDSDVLAPAAVTCSDNCDGDITPVFSETDTGTCPRTIVRTWTCTDTCGNEVSDSQTTTINDTTDPVLSGVPDDATDECDADVPTPPTVTCSDNCDGDITPVFSETDSGTCPRTIVRTWTCTDTCGNEVTDSQTITINDVTDPALSGVPDDVTEQCDADIPAVATVTCSDNCDGDITPVFSETDNGTCPRTIVRTWTCTDSCGNEVSDSQTITINDTTDPVLSGVPGDATGQCDSDVLAPAAVTCSDNCDGDITPVFSETDNGTCPRTIVRTWTCTDSCGNEVSASQTITINDTTDPVLSGVPDDATGQCDEDVVAPAAVTCDDNCDGDITPVFSETDTGTCPRTIVRTWTCTDTCGNEVSESQTIIIDDTIPPTVTCPADMSGTCGNEFHVVITADDNCDPDPTITCAFTDPADPDRFTAVIVGNGVYDVTIHATTVVTVTCDATDDCNNTGESCSFTLDATCNQACSPGFWRNNLDSWCSETPYNPTQDFCAAGAAPTGFVEVFGACPAAPSSTAIANDPGLTLHEAVNSSGGTDQTLFHCTAALLSAHAVSFPVDPDGVISTVQDACDGTIPWMAAFQTCKVWNDAEDDGGCPID